MSERLLGVHCCDAKACPEVTPPPLYTHLLGRKCSRVMPEHRAEELN